MEDRRYVTEHLMIRPEIENSLPRVIEGLQEIIDNYSDQFDPDRIYISLERDWDDYPEARVYGERLETKEEYENRVIREKDTLQRQIDNLEHRAQQLKERLKESSNGN